METTFIDQSTLPLLGTILFDNLGYSVDEIIKISQLDVTGRNTGNRIKLGTFVEHIVVTIFKYGNVFSVGMGRNKRILKVDVEHIPCVFTPGMSRSDRSEVIRMNAVDGDLRIRFEGGDWVYIDVKAGSRIAVDSINRFRSDGFYMMNSLANSKSLFYYLVENNQSFQNAVKEMCLLEGNLYDIHYDKHLRMDKYPDLRFIQTFDAADYRKALISLQAVFTAYGIRNMLNESVC